MENVSEAEAEAEGVVKPVYKKYELFICHALGMLVDRLQDFAIPILLVQIYDTSLILPSFYSLVFHTSCAILLPLLGQWLDQTQLSRIDVVRYSLGFKFIFGCCSALMLLVLNSFQDQDRELFGFIMSYIGVILTAIAAEIFVQASMISLEKDWVVELSQGDDIELENYNLVLRRIDLMAAIIAPLGFGVILQVENTVIGGVVMLLVLNVCSVFPQLGLAQKFYNRNQSLLERKSLKSNSSSSLSPTAKLSYLGAFIKSWKEYIKHPVLIASLSYCILYFTVLDGGALMMAYLTLTKVPSGYLGMSRGFGAILGMIGTLIYPKIRERTNSLERTAVISACFFLVTLCPIGILFSSQLLSENVIGYVMLGLIPLGRVWLWSLDLAHTQIIQDAVEEKLRGQINSIQVAVYNLIWALLGLVSIILSDPKDFAYLTYSSIIVVALSSIGYYYFMMTHPF